MNIILGHGWVALENSPSTRVYYHCTKYDFDLVSDKIYARSGYGKCLKLVDDLSDVDAVTYSWGGSPIFPATMSDLLDLFLFACNSVCWYSSELQIDVPYLHISASCTDEFTLSGNDIVTVDSVGVGTYDLTGSPNRPSLDQTNAWIHFDKSNTEGLINDTIGVNEFAGDDLPYSYAMVVKVNTLDTNFYRFWSVGDADNVVGKPFDNLLVGGASDHLFHQRRDQDTPANTASLEYAGASFNTNWAILTVSFSGTALTMYWNGTKIFDGVAYDVETISNIDQFAIGFFRRNTNSNFIDMYLKEVAFYNTEVGDARLQAWNAELNSHYGVY